MPISKQLKSSGAPGAYAPPSSAEKLEEDASLAAEAAAEGVRGVEVAAIVLLGLLVCPPLAILAVVVIVPVLVTALVLGLLAAVLSVPYLLFRHFRGDHGNHLSLLAHRLRRAGHAVIDLAPHRIVADARKVDSSPWDPTRHASGHDGRAHS
jgi:hypothetical protein